MQAAQASGAQPHHAYESMCHQTPCRQRKTPGLPASQAQGNDALLRPAATPSHNLVILRSALEPEGCPESVNAPPGLG